jgi:subtilisin family serine protease
MRRSRAGRLRAPAALLASLAVAAAPATGAPRATSALTQDPQGVLAELVQDVGGRGASESPQRYAYLQKLDGRLQAVAANLLGTGSPASALVSAEREGVTASSQGDVSVDVYVSGDVTRAAEALRGLGMHVSGTSARAPQEMVEGFIPAGALPAAAALPATRSILTPVSNLSTGSVLSQGDAAIHGPQARGFGAQGAGVKVGVISDSIDEVGMGIAGSQATGDLPPSVENLGDLPGGTDEGRAMAEIVYDEAPAISGIAFATAAGGPQAKANSIDQLVSHGVKVIADDTSYITEPFFQDDVVAQAVDRAKAAGVAYFIAAGNDADQSWEGTYNGGGGSQDFDPGPGTDQIQTIGTIPAGATVTIVLQWAQPWGAATTDFAFDVYDTGPATPVLFGSAQTIDSVATGLPLEYGIFTAPGPGPLTLGVRIRRSGGSGSPFMKYIAYTNGAPLDIEHATDSGAVSPDAASARGALTVAASSWTTPALPEAYSARGPVTRRFAANGAPLAVLDVRQKPNLAGPDAVSTSVPGFAPFRGTSAAAPAAAGIAALLLSAHPGLSVDALYATMTNATNALDCPAAGNPDVDCGAGFLLADRALPMVLDGTPPVITPVISPAAPDGAGGWYRVPVAVSWTVTDPESPVVDPLGCGTIALGDGVDAISCTATSAGGTTSVAVTLKRDASLPAAPLIGGISPKSYLPAALPAASAIGCVSADPTSGVAACSIAGYSTAAGTHTLTATATNGAGLAATSTLSYTVARPVAIARLALAQGLTLRKLVKTGLPLTVNVATAPTKLVATLTARLPAAKSKAARTIVLGTLTRRVAAGKAHLRIRLTAQAKRQLKGVARTRLKVALTGTSGAAQRKLLTGSLAVRR